VIYLIAAAVILVVPVLLLVVSAVLKAAHTRPGEPGSRSHGTLERVVLVLLTRTIRTGLRIGVRFGPMVMLTVPGRTTGLPRSNPVDLWEDGPRRYLVATHDDTAAWVRNLRASGRGSVRLGRKSWEFTAVELPQDRAGQVLHRVLAPRMRRPVGGFVLRQTLGVPHDAPPADFVAAAAQHPVFELSPTNEPDRHARAADTTTPHA
jgi:deazaflavin-dependent oxidoreductase (nitroreductase family)